MRSLAIASLAALQIGLATASDAAQIEVFPDEKGGLTYITVEGNFELGDERRFIEKALPVERGVVAFNSEGGNAHAGIEIGKAIRLKGFATYVPDNRVCASACGLAWLGGIERLAEQSALVGFHAVYTTDSGVASESGSGNALVGAYLSELGLEPSAIAYVTSASPETMNWLSMPVARLYGIEATFLPTEPASSTAGGNAMPVAAKGDLGEFCSSSLGSDGKGWASFGAKTEAERQHISVADCQLALNISPEKDAKPMAPASIAELSQEQVTAFVLETNSALSQYDKTSASRLAKYYAENVDFFGKQMSLHEVIEDKRNYADRWPARAFTVDQNSLSVTCSSDTRCSVSYQVRWIVESPVRNKTLRGVSQAQLSIEMTAGGPKIVSEDGKVVTR
jgi:hypothetical protein